MKYLEALSFQSDLCYDGLGVEETSEVWKMKKRRFLLIAVVAALGMLSGCGKETAELSQIKTEKYVELGAYTGLSASAPAPEVTEEQIENRINSVLRNKVGPVEVTDRDVRNGDTVNIDYEGKMDGVAFEGGTDQGYDLVIGSGSFIDGFEEGLIGAKPGETRDLNISFPDPYPNNPDLAGKPVVFTVKVNSIQGVPDLTDELVKNLDEGCSTAEEYRQKVLEQLIAEANAEFDNTIETELVEQLAANATFKKDPPEAMVQQYLDRIRSNLEAAAQYYNTSFGDLLQLQYGITEEQFEDEARPGAVESAKESILLQAIANKEGLNPTEEEIQAAMEADAKERGFESVDAFKEAIDELNYRDYTMVQKVLDFVKEQSTIEETEE